MQTFILGDPSASHTEVTLYMDNEKWLLWPAGCENQIYSSYQLKDVISALRKLANDIEDWGNEAH